MQQQHETLELYVKSTSNCPGMPLISFELLSPTWQGNGLRLPFGEKGTGRPRYRTVVGWTDLYGGSACPVRVVKARVEGHDGYLVFGGNSGVRILDEQAPVHPGVDDHLPRGTGQPIIWVEDVEDLPEVVRLVVEPPAEAQQ